MPGGSWILISLFTAKQFQADHYLQEIIKTQKENRIIFYNLVNHEIKRRLLRGRKVMTNLDSIFKSRDITLPTKVRLVKAVVFPVVMYGCKSWTIKNTER